MIIEAEWEGLRHTNSPQDTFILYSHYFRLNLDETCFLYNEGELKVVGANDKTCHKQNCSYSRFSITVLQVGSAEGVNGPVILIANGTKMHPLHYQPGGL